MLTSTNGTAKSDPEVLEKARRRRFTAEYKAMALREEFATQMHRTITDVAEFELVLAHLRVPETV